MHCGVTIASIGGSVVEFSPATREARVHFPADATFVYKSRISTKYLYDFMFVCED